MADIERSPDLSRHLVIDESVDVVPATVARLTVDRRPARRRLAVAFGIVVVVCLVVLAVPAPRRAIADFFGIGGVHLRYVDEVPSGLGDELDLGSPVSISRLRGVAFRRPMLPEGVGLPSAGFIGRPPGGVTAVWAPSSSVPEVPSTGVGLLITSFFATTDRGLIEKELPPGTTVDVVTVDGNEGYWIEGAHTFHYVSPTGRIEMDSARLAGNTLIWVDRGVTYRLESALSLEAALKLAESLEPFDS